MPQIRITGLVKRMTAVRQMLDAGVPPERVEDFRALVRNSVAQVEAICQAHGLAPTQLPWPSLHAYQYLKSIDLDALPLRAEAGADPSAPRREKSRPRVVRLANLTKVCQDVQTQLGQITQAGKPQEQAVLETARLLLSIQGHVADVKELSEQQGGKPEDLPAPSRRAYLWLRFLSKPEDLKMHLESLLLAQRCAREAACRKKAPRAWRNLPLHVTLFNVNALYRSRSTRSAIELVIHEGYAGAPEEVFEALACCALVSKVGNYATTVRDYAKTEAFTRLAENFTVRNEPLRMVTRGQVYDLEEVFQRVNREYFHSGLPRPRLTWSNGLTRRKFGHYQPSTDTVMVSLTLDGPGVPAQVVEFIMYHELLHKQLGVKEQNGRRYAHTAEFRRAERQFPGFEEVQTFLQGLAAGQKTPAVRSKRRG